MINILHITPDFNYCCGRSKLVYLYLQYFSKLSDYQVHFITNGGDSLERLKGLPNLKFQTLKFSKGLKNIFHLKSIHNELNEYILQNRINLIHTHHRFPELLITSIAKKNKIKTITSAHSFVTGFKNLSFKSDKIISVSNVITKYLNTEFKISIDRIITLPNPVEQFTQPEIALIKKIREEKNILESTKLLLFVGRIAREKGFDTLINSFAKVTERIKNTKLIIVGLIEDKIYSQMYINTDEQIILLPPQNDINYLYSISDIIILPSRVDPFPFVMIEAGIFQKPFIGGNTGGIAEFIEDGKNGLLIEPGNPEQLAEKIIYLLENPVIGNQLGQNLFEKVNSLCNYNNYFNEVEKIYNSLLSAK